MSKLKQILDKLEKIKTQQKKVRAKLSDIDELVYSIEQLFDLGIKSGDLITAIKLAQHTLSVLEMAKEYGEEDDEEA